MAFLALKELEESNEEPSLDPVSDTFHAGYFVNKWLPQLPG